MLTSPLRYPGGKAKLFPYFSALLKQNGFSLNHYCEPYAGGAGLALKLVSCGLVDHAFLNDIDEAVWAFWTSALHHNEELCHLVRSARLDLDEWHRQREVWRDKDTSNVLALGFATFYLNRTNRSGIIEGAGPVGGYSQTGAWRLDARFDREKQEHSIRALAPFRSRITVSQLDALDFLEISLANSDAVTYLDPPYYVKGSKLYRNAYVHSDHEMVRDVVARYRDGRWVVSYDAVEPILKLYSSFEPTFYSLSYSAGPVGTGREVIYLSDALCEPVINGFVRNAA